MDDGIDWGVVVGVIIAIMMCVGMCVADSDCKKRGGALLETAFSYECVKVQTIP